MLVGLGGFEMSRFIVDGWNNFCRVFELPEEYPKGYCFQGGRDVVFKMVDWFNPVNGIEMAACSKDIWVEKVGMVNLTPVDGDELSAKLTVFLKGKKYYNSSKKYLVMCDFGFSFVF